jgi:hypothetical protein
MKTLAALALVMFTLAPAQTADLTGKWAGAFNPQLPDGTTREDVIEMNLIQKGKVISGTAGPNAERQWPISNGVIDGAKVTFDVTNNDGMVIKFALTSAKDRLTGDADASSGGQTRKAKIDVTKAK